MDPPLRPVTVSCMNILYMLLVHFVALSVDCRVASCALSLNLQAGFSDRKGYSKQRESATQGIV